MKIFKIIFFVFAFINCSFLFGQNNLNSPSVYSYEAAKEIVELEKANDIEHLELSNRDCGKLNKTKIILEFENLESLVLLSNKITLPQDLSSMSELIRVDIYGEKLNNLRDVFESLATLSNLETLILRGNLSTIPISIINLKNLKKLDLSENNLSVIPKYLSDLDKLETLDLSKNRISQIDFSLNKFKELKNLDLSHNDLGLSNNWIFLNKESNNIESLNISFNNIIEIPCDIENIKSLKRITIIDSNLVLFPTCFNDFYARIFHIGTTKTISLENINKNIPYHIAFFHYKAPFEEKLFELIRKEYPNLGIVINFECIIHMSEYFYKKLSDYEETRD